MAFEATGVPSIFRAAGSAGQGKMPATGDILGTAATLLPGAGLAKAGISGTKIAGGLAAGALGAGVGEAALGPEARQLGYKVGGETGAMIGGIAPALLGGVAGPMAVQSALKLPGAGMAAATRGPQAGADALRGIKFDLPIAARQGALVESGEALTPAALQRAAEFEQRTGIKPTPGQMQFLEGGQARTPIKDTEYRLKQNEEALKIGKDQAQQFGQYAERTLDEVAPGASRGTASIGADLQAQAIKQLEDAGARYEAAESAVLNAPGANKITLNYVGKLKDAVKGIVGEYKAPGGKSALPPELQTMLNQIEPWTKTAGNLRDAVQFRRVLKGMTARFQPGTPEHRAARQLDSAIDSAIEGAATKQQRGPLRDFFEASKAYRQAKFSDEAGLVESLTGVDYAKKSALPTRTPEDVVKKIFQSPSNMAPRLMQAEAKGNITPGSVRQAAGNYLLQTAQAPDGSIDYGKLARAWNGLADSQKTVLFGENVSRINQIVKDAEALTFVGRYQPPTGASLPVLLPGLEEGVSAVAGMIPGIGRPLQAAIGAGSDKLAALSHFNLKPSVAVPPTSQTRALEAAMLGGNISRASVLGNEDRIRQARSRAENSRPQTFYQSLSR
jgi:hypothetical protein